MGCGWCRSSRAGRVARVAGAGPGAEPQCADPAMCQSEPANPEDCNGGPDDMVCTRAGDAELHSSPNPADIPEVPQAEQPPWVVFGNPGMGH